METVDHVVIGAGAMGAATAWKLAQQGRSVVLIEQFGVAHKNGSSHGGTRIFRLSYRNPLYTDLAMKALPLWRELEAETGEVLLEQNGQIDHGFKSAIDDIQDALDRHHRPYELLSPEAAHERWPGMNFDQHVIFSPDGGRNFADRTVTVLCRRFVELGGQLSLNNRVHDISVEGEYAYVETEDGEWKTKSVVVAAGAWVEKLVGGLVKLPKFTIDAGQPAHFQPLANPTDDSVWPSFLHHAAHKRADTDLAFSAYGLFTPGEGMKVGTWANTDPVDPDHRDFSIDGDLLDGMKSYVREWFPGLDVDSASPITCLFTNTVDEHFVLDRKGPITVCSPCSGHGFKFVPAIGDLTAKLAMGGTQSVKEWQLPA